MRSVPKRMMLKVLLHDCDHLVEKARSPAVSVQCKHGSLCEKGADREEDRQKQLNVRRGRGLRERDCADRHSRGHAVLRIRLSMNLINMASLISIREYSTEGHPLCFPPPSSHFDYTDA